MLKKKVPHSLSFSEIIDSERRGFIKSIKGPVSGNPSSVNELTSPRDY